MSEMQSGRGGEMTCEVCKKPTITSGVCVDCSERAYNIGLDILRKRKSKSIQKCKKEEFTPKEAETIHQAILAYSPHPKVIDSIASKLTKMVNGWRR